MKRLQSIIFLSLLLLNTSYSLALAHHANEKYCFDCMHKYKIGDKKNDTYNFDINLQNNDLSKNCLLYTSPSPRDNRVSRMPSSA